MNEERTRATETLAGYLRARGLDVRAPECVATRSPVVSARFAGEDGGSLLVVFLTSKVRRQMYLEVQAALEQSPGAERIFLVLTDATLPREAVLASLTSIPVEAWTQAELQYDVLNHVLNPRMRKMSADEGRAVLQRFNIESVSRAPLIRASDPVARALSLVEGDVVRIERCSMTVAYYEYFRLCVADHTVMDEREEHKN